VSNIIQPGGNGAPKDIGGLDEEPTIYYLLASFGDHEAGSPEMKRNGTERLPAGMWSIACKRCKHSALMNGQIQPCDIHGQLANNPLVVVVKIWAMTREVWDEAHGRMVSMNRNYPPLPGQGAPLIDIGG
jgi:hypothetical protein